MMISGQLLRHLEVTETACNASLIQVKPFPWFGTASEEEVAVSPSESKTTKNIKLYDRAVILTCTFKYIISVSFLELEKN